MIRKTKAQICDSVKFFHDKCSGYGFISANGQINLGQVLEYLGFIWKKWDFKPAENEEMGSLLGKACPSEKLITLRLDVYEGAVKGDPEHCFTVAHELGHMVIHSELEFARREDQSLEVNVLEDVEDEADLFARELLGFNSPAAEKIEAEFRQLIEDIKKSQKK